MVLYLAIGDIHIGLIHLYSLMLFDILIELKSRNHAFPVIVCLYRGLASVEAFLLHW